ncbi:MAG: YicC/YloC family endoribonuclease, partial [Oscillospiraceae bacterium]
MIKSMTGYGRELCSFEDRDILVEIRSVNHRYYEFSAKVPRAYGYLEAKLKEFLNGKIARGKVEVSVSVYNKEGRDVAVAVNTGVAGAYINALREANKELELTDDITLSRLLGLPDVFIVNKEIEDEEVIWAEVSKTAEAALQRFLDMREREGEA